MRVTDLAGWLQGRWEGNADAEITGVAEISAAGPNDVAFVSGAKAAEQAAGSGAGCLLVAEEFPEESGHTVIRVADPRASFIRVIGLLHPARPRPEGIHPTAVVSPEVELGAGVAVGPYTVIRARARIGAGTTVGAGCHIGEDVTIGEGGLLHDGVTIYDYVAIGRNAVIHSGAVLGADGFGFAMVAGRYEKFPQIGTVSIGDDVEIGANSCVDRAALGVTSIGDGVKLDNMVHVAHNATIGNHVVIAAQTGISGGAVIEDYVVIAGQVGIADKVRVETRAVLGAQCGVPSSKIIRSGQTVWGTPARPIKEYLAQMAQISKIAGLREEVQELRRRLDRLEKGDG